MNHELQRLAERRRQLVQRAAVERCAIAEAVAPWRPRLALVDQGIAVFAYLLHHPMLIAGMAAAVAMVRPRRAGKWLQRGWLLWQVGRGLRRGVAGKP